MKPAAAQRPKHPAIGWLCVLSPIYLILTWLTLAAHVRLGLGHWPKPMIETYETPLFEIHAVALVVILIFAAFIAPALWTLLLLFRQFRGSLRYHVRQLAYFALAWLLIIAAANLDPTTFTEWFLD